MKFHIGRRLFIVAAVLGGLAVLASGFLVAVGLRSAYAFDPVTHGYIGQETGEVVRIGDDGRQPDDHVFHSGAISADVMHLDNAKMHDNPGFSEVMMNIAGDTKQLSYGASFMCHQKSDQVWVDWAYDHGVPRGATGGLAGLLALPIEGFYEFLFGSYAVLYKGYVIPTTLYMDKGLIQRAYDAVSGGANQPPGGQLEIVRAFLWCMMVGEYLLIWHEAPVTLAAFALSPWGPYHTVKESFTGTMNTAISNSRNAIQSKWYETKLVGTEKRSCEAGLVWGKDCDKCQEEQDPNKYPLLTGGWERSHVEIFETHTEWGSGFCGDGWEWTTTESNNPNVYIRMWANAPERDVWAKFNIWAKLKKPLEDKTVPLGVSSELSDEMENKRAAMTFTIDDPLLTESQVNLEDIKDRQDTLLGNIWKAVGEAGETIYYDDIAKVDGGELAYNEQLANLIANTAVEKFEKPLLNYYVLETRKQAILSGADIIQPMPGEILPYGVEAEVPAGKPIMVFASDFDYFLGFDLVNFLKDHNYKPIRKVGTEWNDCKQKEKRIAVVGGLYPSQGVDSIIQELLTHVSNEQRAELAGKGYLYTVLNDVFTEGQRILLFVGKDSFNTRRAIVDGTQLPVGGAVELVVDGSDSSLRPPQGSGSSAPPYAAMAGGVAAALAALGAGAWYARRRWPG